MSNVFLSFFNPERKRSFVLPFVTLSRPLSPYARKGPLRTFLRDWRGIVAESQVAGFAGGGGRDRTRPVLSLSPCRGGFQSHFANPLRQNRRAMNKKRVRNSCNLPPLVHFSGLFPRNLDKLRPCRLYTRRFPPCPLLWCLFSFGFSCGDSPRDLPSVTKGRRTGKTSFSVNPDCDWNPAKLFRAACMA